MSSRKHLAYRGGQGSDPGASSNRSSEYSKRKTKRWQAFVPLKTITTEQALESLSPFSNQFEHVMLLINKLEGRANSSIALARISRTIKDLAVVLRSDLRKYRSVWLNENSNDDPEEEPAGENIEEILREINERRGSADSDLSTLSDPDYKLDSSNVMKVFPKLEATLHNFVRRLSLIGPPPRQSTEGEVMVLLAALRILPTFVNRLRNLVPLLSELGCYNSRDVVVVKERLVSRDMKDIVDNLLQKLPELNGDRFMQARAQNLLFSLNEAMNEEIDHNLIFNDQVVVEDVKNVVIRIGNLIDREIAEINGENFYLGDFEFKDEMGDAHKAACEMDGGFVSVLAKNVTHRSKLGPVARRELQTELDNLRKVGHERIIEFFGTVVKEEKLYLVWKYYKCSLHMALFDPDTQNLLEGNEFVLTNNIVMRFAMDILRGLEYLHNSGIVHQQVNTLNIFFKDDNSALVLGDFSFVDGKKEAKKNFASEGVEGEDLNVSFAETYAAPESLFNPHRQGHNKTISVFASDIYSFAIVLFEMIEREKAYAGLSKSDFSRKVFGDNPKRPNFRCPEKIPEVVMDLINRCWQPTPELRPSADWTNKRIKDLLGEEDDSSAEGGEEVDGEARDKFLNWLPLKENGPEEQS